MTDEKAARNRRQRHGDGAVVGRTVPAECGNAVRYFRVRRREARLLQPHFARPHSHGRHRRRHHVEGGGVVRGQGCDIPRRYAGDAHRWPRAETAYERRPRVRLRCRRVGHGVRAIRSADRRLERCGRPPEARRVRVPHHRRLRTDAGLRATAVVGGRSRWRVARPRSCKIAVGPRAARHRRSLARMADEQSGRPYGGRIRAARRRETRHLRTHGHVGHRRDRREEGRGCRPQKWRDFARRFVRRRGRDPPAYRCRAGVWRAREARHHRQRSAGDGGAGGVRARRMRRTCGESLRRRSADLGDVRSPRRPVNGHEPGGTLSRLEAVYEAESRWRRCCEYGPRRAAI